MLFIWKFMSQLVYDCVRQGETMKEFRGKDHKFDYDKIKKKRHCTLQSLLIAGIAILLCLSAVMLLVAKSRDQRASSSVPLPVEIYGEYSWDNVNWQPLSEDADLNALKGDLYVRGHFSNDFTGKQIMVYLDHIYYSISVNGEQTAGYIPRHAFDEPDVCGNDWSAWYLGDDVTVSSKIGRAHV